MACRGVHFAITPEEASRLLSAPSDSDLLEIVQEEIEQRWEDEWLVSTDKAWDAIHRCLAETEPLHLAILGGQDLYKGDDYIIALITPDEVTKVAHALALVNQSWLQQKYDEIDPDAYGYPKSSEDFDYTWDYFQSLPDFFNRARDAGRYVIFTVDQ